MAKHPTAAFVSPIGTLKWCYITGEGKENLQGQMQYTASVYVTPEEAAPFIEKLEAFWEDNKPKGAKNPKTLGYHEEKDKDGELTGLIGFTFKTGVVFPDGSKKVIDTYNKSRAKVSLGTKRIGNGSRGALSGQMGIYDQPGNAGVTLYLNAVQIIDFVEYNIDPGFAAVEDGSFEAIEGDDSGFTAVAEDHPKAAEAEAPAKPRL